MFFKLLPLFVQSTLSSTNLSILGSNKKISTNYMTALGLNQAIYKAKIT